MAARNRKVSLAEVIGSKGVTHGLTLDKLPEVLGDAMPELPRTTVGRHRLIRSLQQRFGPNFRSLPGVSSLVAEFDRDLELERKVAQIAALKMRKR